MMQWAGPLGTFSSRIALGYTVDLLPPWLYRNLEIVRQIRNDFAHGYTPADFTQPELDAKVRLMQSPEYDAEADLERVCTGSLADVSRITVPNEARTKELAVAQVLFAFHVASMAAWILTTAQKIKATANKTTGGDVQ